MEREQFGALGASRDGLAGAARAGELEIPITTTAGASTAGASTAGAVSGPVGGSAEPSLGELFKRLTTDTSDLVRQEIALARAEMRQIGGTIAKDGAKLGVALGLALAGTLALTAFVVVAVGDLINNYWLGALIVGLLLLGVGALLARNAVADIKQRAVPEHTLASLREDAAWAKQETREVKRELTR